MVEAQPLGHDPEPLDGGPLNWTSRVAGVVSVYAALFGMGRIPFGQFALGLGFLAAAALCFAWIARNLGSGATEAGAGSAVESGEA